MNLKIKRPNKDSVTVDMTDFGTILVFQQMGKKDNKHVKNLLTEHFGTEPINIHYEYKLVSVFIFNMGGRLLSKSELSALRNKLGGKQKYAVVQGDGTIAKGSTLQQLNVQCLKDQINVNQKFTMLLSVKKRGAAETVSS